MKIIPLIDLKKQYESLKVEIDAAIAKIIENTSFINGKEIEEFDKNFADFCGKSFATSVDNGTAALYIALRCLGVKEGDEVIIPVNTFIATVEAIRLVGARPVMVDINDKHLMDVNLLEKRITSKTKAILPVHLYGNVCDMNHINKIAQKHNLFVLEDCAQAHGSKLNGVTVPISKMGCFSFFPGKSLGAYGDGGAIVSSDELFVKKCKKYADHGRIDKYIHDEDGFNFRMDTLQAAILNVKLKHLHKALERKRELADIYTKNLQGVVETPIVSKDVYHSYHLYVIMVDALKRDKLKEFLDKNGVKSGIHYPLPLNMQPALAYLGYKKGDFPVAEKFSEKILSLPMYPEMTNEEANYITDKIKEFLV